MPDENPKLKTKTRRRGGGRAAVARTPVGRAPYIKRSFDPICRLDEDGLQLIERNADSILQETGMEFQGDAEALELLRSAGADVKGERVRFERGMCREIIQATAPREFAVQARNPANTIHIGGANTVFSPVQGPPFVHDIDRGRRYASTEDYIDLVKLAHMLPSLHMAGSPCELSPEPIRERPLHTAYAQYRYSDKAVSGAARSAEEAEDAVAMARIVFGDAYVGENCCLYSGVNTNSPLILDDTMMAALKVYARHNPAIFVSAYVLGGAMGPMSVAGSLAQQLAESMAGLALVQLVRPGVPCGMGAFIGAVSMQNGSPVYGTPEALQGIAIAAELARRLGVPSTCAGGAVTALKIPDAQAALESALTLQNTFHAGVNKISHAAGWLEGGLTAGFEKMISTPISARPWNGRQGRLISPARPRLSTLSGKSGRVRIFSAAPIPSATSKRLSGNRPLPTAIPMSNGRTKAHGTRPSGPTRSGSPCWPSTKPRRWTQRSTRRFATIGIGAYGKSEERVRSHCHKRRGGAWP